MEYTKTHIYRTRLRNLKNDQSSWRSHWKEISEVTVPRKGKYLSGEDATQSHDGAKRNQKIINGTAGDALKVLAAGMQGGMTSPSRPWFNLEIPDKELMEYGPVKEWLMKVRNLILSVYARSNFYGAMHSLYKELGAFGVGTNLQEEDFNTLVRFRPFTIGEFYLALDPQYRPSTMFRQFSLTAEQMFKEFGEEVVSESVKTAIKTYNYEARFMVNHVIEPNPNSTGGIQPDGTMDYNSLYFQEDGDPDIFLREKGYDGQPFIAPRWDVVSTDIYGTSPAMDSLGDILMLQKMESKSLKALDKLVDPPMNAHPSLKAQGGSIVPGHVNYITAQQGQTGFSPAYQINPDIQNIEYKITRVEERIKRMFFNDLFLMIVNDQKSQTTAYEIAKKHEEKLLMLGPVIERIQSESHDPTIDRTYKILDRFGMIPEPPQELKDGQALRVEYISILAQAQKMVGTTSIEQTTSYIGNLAAIKPEALDKLDIDQAIDEYSTLVGVPPAIIRGDDEVEQIRQQRAAQQQALQQQEQTANTVQGAKALSETKMGEDTALDRIIGGIQRGY